MVPESLSIRACKDVSSSLEKIVLDPSKNAYRQLAIDMIGSGFAIWEPHFNCASILRTLAFLSGANGGHNGTVSKQALMAIACLNPGLFISTFSFDLIHCKDIPDKVGSLQVLASFLSKVL